MANMTSGRRIAFSSAGLAAVAAAGVLLLSACAGTKPEPLELRDARLALQDARNAGADQYAAEKLASARAHLVTAENTFKAGREADAVHYARLADSEARSAQYQAETKKARERIESGTKRLSELEIAVRDAEIKAQAVRARSEAEQARRSAESRAREERERSEAAQREREASQASTEERMRALQARLDAERQKSAEMQQQAQIDALKAQIDEQKRIAAEQVAAAKRALEEERARAEDVRRLAAEREKTQADLLARLQLIERSTRVEPRGIVLTLPGSVYFDSSRSDVKPGARERLAQIGQALAAAPDRKIVVEGHTDSTGSPDFNVKLSELRAESVKAVLVENGVSPDRIETHGYASTKPVASNASPAGRSQNRRVEVVVQGALR